MSNLIYKGDSLKGFFKRAKELFYDNSESGLLADNVQDAVDELKEDLAVKSRLVYKSKNFDGVTDATGGISINGTTYGMCVESAVTVQGLSGTNRFKMLKIAGTFYKCVDTWDANITTVANKSISGTLYYWEVVNES